MCNLQILDIKDLEFDFRMGCNLYTYLIFIFMNKKRAIYRFSIFEFFIFKYSDIGLLWSKITIFIIGITIKLLLHTKYGWNNPNWGRLGLKNPKLHFLAISASSKFIAYTNIQVHVTRSIFIVNWFFLNACNNVFYQN